MLSGSFSELCSLKIRFCLAFFSSIILLLLYSCEDEPVKRDYPRVSTLEVSNITEAGATFNAEVIDEGNVEIDDHGFFWSTLMISPASSEKVSLGAFDGTGDFSADITTTLEEGVVYIVSAYLKAGEYTVFGEEMKFTSLGSGAPEITGFNPTLAGWGDTIVITGRKFSNLTMSNKIIIEDQLCIPFYANDSLLKFTLPGSVTHPLNTVSVSISGNIATADAKLSLIPPEAYGFTPLVGHWGDTITFTGLRLNWLGQSITDGALLNGSILSKIISKSSDTASFIIPGQLETTPATVSLTYSPFNFSFDQTLELLPPEFDSVSPVEGTWGSVLTLYGRFNNLPERNTVLFGDKQAQIMSASYCSINVKVPDNLTDYTSIISYSSGTYVSDFTQEFTLKEPEIIDFTPKQGYVGNLVTIKGKYFKKNVTTVNIGGTSAVISSVNDSLITFYVPGDIHGENTITVSLLGHSVVAEELFNATNQVITDINPIEAINGDTITLAGTNFRSGTIIYLDYTYKATLLSLKEDEIKFVVPQSIGFGAWSITAKWAYLQSGIWQRSDFTYPDPLILRDFTITDITPLSGKYGDLLTITGTNFHYPVVTFGSVEAEVTESTSEQIIVKVPPLSAGDCFINVTVGTVTHEYPFAYTHSGPWQRLADLPFLYLFGCVFDFGEEVYIASGNGDIAYFTRELYRFDPDILGFSKLPGIWETGISCPISCTLDGKGYIIGLKENGGAIGFEVFDPDYVTWQTLPDFPGLGMANVCLIADDSVLYAGSGFRWGTTDDIWFSQFWKYSPKSNSWTRIADSPYYISFTNHIYIDGRLLFLGFDDFSDKRYLLEYLPLTDTWMQKEISEEDLGYWGLHDIKLGARVSLISDGKWYLGFGDMLQTFDWGNYYYKPSGVTNRFYCFDPAYNTWTTISNVAAPPRTFAISFTSNGKIYIGGSQAYKYYDFWVYDPEPDQ